jgi:hypothetical protein
MPRRESHPDSARRQTPGRDDELLAALTGPVRAMSVAQIARTWWASTNKPEANTRRRLCELESTGLVVLRELLGHPETPLEAPLAVWWPGRPVPELPTIAYTGCTRWAGLQERTTFVLAGDTPFRQATGRRVRELRVSEATHDLHVATVYLRMRWELPTRSGTWRLEEGFGDSRGAAKVPDAIVRDGQRRTAIEIVGAYEVAKLEAFHRACASRGMGYELW